MLTPSAAHAFGTPAHDIFYVVRQEALVTVRHDLPAGAQELAEFENPCGAVEFAERAARECQARGEAIEFVDPPSGLVGAG
ncbi:MAG TPA: hypothetical protein VKT49_05045 [Bryobacteraceae bacterium]|nr:hypothetical protein [Bryobacteraceae bacterium]